MVAATRKGMMSEPIQGTRLPDGFDAIGVAEGEYCKDANGNWNVRPPGSHLGTLDQHEVTEHEDGTITVKESIQHPDDPTCHWKLEHGKWIQL